MYDPKSGNMRQLHEPNTALEASFDLIVGTMRLQQKLRNPKTWPHAQNTVTVQFSKWNSVLANLEGLADNSLLLTFKILSVDQISQLKSDTNRKPGTNEATVKGILDHGTKVNGIFNDGLRINGKQKKTRSKPMLRQEVLGFFSEDLTDQCPLFKAVHENPDKEKTMQLHLPKSRINPWLTASLILLTFREINTSIWHRLTTNKQLDQDVAGLNWVQVRSKSGLIPVAMTLEAKRRIQAALDKERARSAAIMHQAIHLGLQGDPTGNYMGFSARVRPAKYGQLRAGDLGFRG
jgi:hypothetical protein